MSEPAIRELSRSSLENDKRANSSASLISGRNDAGAVDISVLMADIRARLKSSIEEQGASSGASAQFKGYKADSDRGSARKAGEILHSEDLRYLNQNYAFSSKVGFDNITSHRPGLIGRLIIKAKRKLLRVLWDSLLRDYLASEREFHAHTVRLLNDIAKYVDARDASNFWELIRKIDVDVTKALERIERIADDQNAELHRAERRILDDVYRSLRELSGRLGSVTSDSAVHGAELARISSVVKGLESLAVKTSRSIEITEQQQVDSKDTSSDPSYLLLENRYRGSEEDISKRLEIYPAFFSGAELPVLEIGSGRGELQKLFATAGVKSFGVDLDAAMVEHCAARGLDVRLGDGLAVLRESAPESLGGVIAIQVVEHLTREQLKELLALCASRVCAGGKIAFETINPRSLLALSSNYFRDPTHIFPQHPDTLSFAMELAGFEIEELRMLSPVPQEAQLREIPSATFMPPRWAEFVGAINTNIRQLNQLIYGFQDYCIVGRLRGQ